MVPVVVNSSDSLSAGIIGAHPIVLTRGSKRDTLFLRQSIYELEHARVSW